MDNKIKGELAVMDAFGIKPNYAALGRKYGMDWRTVKKYHGGYKGKPPNRNKGSRLDEYRQEIADRLKIRNTTVRGVYEFMVKKHGIDRIGSYPNFNRYIHRHGLMPNARSQGHPRYEKRPGEQAQVDWKEDIAIADANGEVFVVNVFHMVLKYSRYSYLEVSLQKRFDDVSRCLTNGFVRFGGVPGELLFDNMATVANVNAKPKKPTEAISRMSKDFGFRIRLCGTRKPQTKGTVEARNKVIDWVRAYEGEFEGLDELAGIVERINTDMNITINQETQMSPAALFYKEKECLQPLPARSVIDGYLTPTRYRVAGDALVRYGGSRYSVDPRLIGEVVTADRLGDRLLIYHGGKLVALHAVTGNPINYNEDHYRTLMERKVKQEDMESTVRENLSMMDRLLESRNIQVSEIEATGSADALMAYISRSEYGRWVINHFAHLPAGDRLTFIKGMNAVLPYVANREAFISRIKYSMKDNGCRTIDFDCWVNDYMAAYGSDCILTDEGYKAIGDKYSAEIESLLDEMRTEHELDEAEREREYAERAAERPADDYALLDDEELPFGRGAR